MPSHRILVSSLSLLVLSGALGACSTPSPSPSAPVDAAVDGPVDASADALDPTFALDAAPPKYGATPSCASLGVHVLCDDFENGLGSWPVTGPDDVTIDDSVSGSPTHSLRAISIDNLPSAASRVVSDGPITFGADVRIDELPVKTKTTTLELEGRSRIVLTAWHASAGNVVDLSLDVVNGKSTESFALATGVPVGQWFRVQIAVDWSGPIKIESTFGARSFKATFGSTSPTTYLRIGSVVPFGLSGSARSVVHIDNVTID